MPKDEVLSENEDDIDVVEVDVPAGEEAKAAEEAAAGAKHDVVEVETDQNDEDDEGEQEDARLAERDESEDEAAERKRKHKLGQRQRQKLARDRERQELADLRRKVAELETGYTEIRNTNLSVSEGMVASKLEEVRRDIATAESLLADAVKNQDGDTFAAAIRLRDEAKQQEADLVVAQKGFVEAKKPATGGADPELTRLSSEWKTANASWYGSNAAATAAANAIDAALYAEMGDRANTREYYQELSRRVTAHFNAQGGQTRDRQEPTTDNRAKGPKIGDRGGNGNGAPGGRKVFLSKDRVDAIKAAGDWDDPTERAKAIKAYEAYDREQSAQR